MINGLAPANTTANVGFIGLGAMGRGMAANLHRAGLLAAVWNRSAAAEWVATTGCGQAESLAELAQISDVLILCIAADPDVLDIIGRLQPHFRAGTVVVDCSTVSAATAKTAAAQLAESSVGFIDAPVSGGTEGAANGSLTIMVGGSDEHLELAMPALQAMSSRLIHMGAVGSGQATKAINQTVCAGIAQGVTEGLALAEAAGLPLDKVIDVVGSGAAGSWFMQHRGATMVRGEFPPGFKVALHEKDLQICRAMAAEYSARLVSIEATLSDYQQLLQQGYGEADISALYRRKQQLFSDRSKQAN